MSTYRRELAAAACEVNARIARIPDYRWTAICDKRWSELLRELNEAEQAGDQVKARELVAKWKAHALEQLEPYEKKRIRSS